MSLVPRRSGRSGADDEAIPSSQWKATNLGSSRAEQRRPGAGDGPGGPCREERLAGAVARLSLAVGRRLAPALLDGDAAVRRGAARALAGMGPAAASQAAALERAALDQDLEVARLARSALQQIQGDHWAVPPGAAPAAAPRLLLPLLEAQSQLARRGLQFMMKGCADAVVSQKASWDQPPSPAGRGQFRGSRRADSAQRLPPLHQAAPSQAPLPPPSSPPPHARHAAEDLPLEQLAQALLHEDTQTRLAALRRLRRLGPGEAAAMASVVAPSLRAADERVQALALECLGQAGSAAAPHLQVMARRLLQGGEEVRAKAAWALAELGLLAVPQVEAIARDLDVGVDRALDQTTGPAATAARAAGLLSAATAARFARLALRGESASVRRSALEGLRPLGACASAEADAVFRATRDAEPSVRAAALGVLAGLPGAAARCAPQLVRGGRGTLEDDDAHVRSCVQHVLAQAAPAAAARARQVQASWRGSEGARLRRERDGVQRREMRVELRKLEPEHARSPLSPAAAAALVAADQARGQLATTWKQVKPWKQVTLPRV